MRASIYCRVSTREQSSEDHYSLDNQEQRGRDYLKMKRWQQAVSAVLTPAQRQTLPPRKTDR